MSKLNFSALSNAPGKALVPFGSKGPKRSRFENPPTMSIVSPITGTGPVGGGQGTPVSLSESQLMVEAVTVALAVIATDLTFVAKAGAAVARRAAAGMTVDRISMEIPLSVGPLKFDSGGIG
jgi:hypothetical protein